jgi:hypothetical protein
LRLRLFRDIKTRIFLSVFVFIVHCNDYFRLSANYKRQDYEDTCINSCLTDKQCLQYLQSYIFTPIIHRSDKVYRKFGMPFIVDGKRGRVQGIILESFQPEFYKTSFLTSFFQLIFDGKFACKSVIDGRSYSISISRMLQKKMSSS